MLLHADCRTANQDRDRAASSDVQSWRTTKLVFQMIKFLQGNLLDAPTEALVNTVNTVGVMGKGIALMFKEAFPDNFRAYDEAVKRKEVRIGHMFVTENRWLDGPKWLINFPTKK